MRRVTTIDPLDADIIELPTIHPRIGLLQVAPPLQGAPGTLQSPPAQPAERGAVTGFGPQVDPTRIGYPVLAFVALEITQGRLADAVAHLDALPEVLEAYGTTGPLDVLCRVVARDNEHLQEVINAILQTPAVRRSTSTIAMSRQIAPRSLPLVRAAAS